ncbi:NifB/NifX family molybdenum-iron cluster-binding protein [Geotalea sp. SG265]|uniref:NifB/NifX family molybdenum-iron cluster-binding protein n=1 Tax=Geotalea sp. SG265 TaxID=2922867 RepID=UPI001FB02E5F|nr:NifB/NifX family molybdenum-iron cluster-binding protein [Geotalea sp. SG265]
MQIRVAVATSDGLAVNEHFGRTKAFVIYELIDEQWRQVEERQTLPACNGHCHSGDFLDSTVSLLNDCQGVIVNQIGPTAIDVLLGSNMLPFSLDGSIEEALATVLQSKLFRVRYKLN